MQDLQLVGVHDDGEHLLLTGPDGQRYRLAVDEPLRAAVRRDRARLGQLQIQMQGALRPRDIQARIRAGATAEDVAQAAGLPVEHVRRYEGPVLAEREHVAQLGRRQVVRGAGAGRGPQLGDLVAERLAARGVEGDGGWDAWRRDDGSWTIQVSFRTGSKDRRARWTFDPVRSHLEPADDESRWLSAAEPEQDGPIPARRLSAVKERVYDVEADGGVREARRARGGTTAGARGDTPGRDGDAEGATEPEVEAEQPAAAPQAQTLDLLEELRGRRGRRQPLLSPDDVEDDDPAPTAPGPDPAVATVGDPGVPDSHVADSDVAGGDVADDELPPAAHPPTSRPEEAVDAEILELPAPSDGGTELPGAGQEQTLPAAGDAAPAAREAAPDHSGDAGEQDARPLPPPVKESRRPAGKTKGRRPSVPSWDEIVFGSKKD